MKLIRKLVLDLNSQPTDYQLQPQTYYGPQT